MKTKNVISKRCAGLGDLLLATSHAWYYASNTRRNLEICWAPSLYVKDRSENIFGKIFKVPSSIGEVRIIYCAPIPFIRRFIRRLPLFPPRYMLRTLLFELIIKFFRKRSPEYFIKTRHRRKKYLEDLIREASNVKLKNVIFNSDFNFLDKQRIKPFYDALELKPELQEIINQFAESHFRNKFVIGTHVRYYDTNLPACDYTKFWLDPEKKLEMLKNRLQEIIYRIDRSDYVVYLATNSDIVCDYVRDNINNVITLKKDFPKIKVDWSLHHLLPEHALKDDIIEMFLLKYSNILLRFPPLACSWFSYLGSLYADEVIIT